MMMNKMFGRFLGAACNTAGSRSRNWEAMTTIVEAEESLRKFPRRRTDGDCVLTLWFNICWHIMVFGSKGSFVTATFAGKTPSFNGVLPDQIRIEPLKVLVFWREEDATIAGRPGGKWMGKIIKTGIFYRRLARAHEIVRLPVFQAKRKIT